MNTGTNNEIFRLQPRFLYLEMLFLSAISSLCIISWFPSIFSLLAYEMIIRSAFRAAMFLNCTAFILFILYRHLKSEMKHFSIILSDDQIIKKSFSKTTAVHFSEITDLKYVKIPALRGFLKIYTGDSSFRIPLNVENPTVFMALLRTKLNDNTKIWSNIADSNLNEDLTVFHDSYQRSVKAFTPLIFISLGLFILNIIIAVQFWGLALIPILLFAMSGLILPSIAYTIADIKLNQSVRNLLRSDTAVIHNANIEYLYCGLLTFIFYLVIGILFKAVFLWY